MCDKSEKNNYCSAVWLFPQGIYFETKESASVSVGRVWVIVYRKAIFHRGSVIYWNPEWKMTAGWSPCIHLNTATNTPCTEFTTVNPLLFIKQLFRQARRWCQESWYETNFPTVKLMIAHFWRNNSSFDMKTWHARDCDAVTSCEQTITNFTFYLKYPDRINRVHRFEAWHWSGYVQAVSFSTVLL